MGMTTHVVAIKPADETFSKMKQIYDNCEKLEIEIPEEVDEFFNGEAPDGDGVVINIEDEDYVYEYEGDMEDGYQIDVTNLPKHIKYIRVYNSW